MQLNVLIKMIHNINKATKMKDDWTSCGHMNVRNKGAVRACISSVIKVVPRPFYFVKHYFLFVHKVVILLTEPECVLELV